MVCWKTRPAQSIEKGGNKTPKNWLCRRSYTHNSVPIEPAASQLKQNEKRAASESSKIALSEIFEVQKNEARNAGFNGFQASSG